ncbi:MAG: 50S ribosomal protein L25 [Patescibacteria group bacterium]|nr:50S ribosomal protein L25 [Patescibacteria group bacterium]
MATFKAKKREILGKKVKKLRRGGYVPAVLVERGETSVPLVLDYHQFLNTYQEARDSSVVDLEIDSEQVKVIVSEIQLDPLSGKPVHVNFRRIHEGEKIATAVPIRFKGTSPVVDRGDGLLLTLLDQLEVEALPKHLPSEIEVDISDLENVGDFITIKDLPLDLDKVTILGHEPDDFVVKIEEPEMEEVEEYEEEVLFGFEEELEEEEEEMEEVAEVVAEEGEEVDAKPVKEAAEEGDKASDQEEE